MRPYPSFASLFWLLLPALAAVPGRAQNIDSLIVVWEQRVEAADTRAQQVPALSEYARFLNRAERFAEALDAISEAAQLRAIPSAVDMRAESLPDSLDATLRILLIRAVAQEGLSQFAEARNDYRTFLAVAPNSGAARIIRQRMEFIDRSAVADLATLARFNPEDLGRFYDARLARLQVAILPFFNESDNLLWNFVGYGLAGYLSQTISLLGKMVDLPLSPVSRSEVMAALNSVSLGRFYSDDNPISPVQVAGILGSQFSITGRVGSGTGGLGLRITPLVGSPDGDSVIVIETLEDSSLPEGLERLQTDLGLVLADQLQQLTGFSYLDSREAFADSLRALIVPDLQRFVAYGRSVELSLAGDIEAAEPLLEGSHAPLARLDHPILQTMRSGADTPSFSLAQVQEVIAPFEETVAEDRQTATRPGRPRRVRPESPSGLAEDPTTLVSLLNAASLTLLGASAIEDTRVGADVRPGGSLGSTDPRDGVEGLNRIEPGRTTIQIIIPVPPPSGGGQN